MNRQGKIVPPIYLDFNATTPIAPEVSEAMKPFLSNYFGNPSSGHWYGLQAKKSIEKSRRQVASLLGCAPDEIVFTSGGSESNNLAIKGFAFANRDRGNHIITSQIEHPAVKNVCSFLEKQLNFEITYIPVNSYGMIQIDQLEAAIKSNTIIISIMHANNEVGTIQPIEEISKIAKHNQISLHTDAAQSVGKIVTNVNDLGVDMLSLAGHKLYAPKGIGALYIRRGLKIEPLVHGASHEAGRRAGTENVLEIVGLGAAATLAEKNLAQDKDSLQALRDRLWNGLKAQIPELVLNGHPSQRLPNTLNISFPGIDANTLLDELEEIAASPGAACHTGTAEPSAVMIAMKVPLELALGTIRFSTGHLNNEDQIDRAIKLITAAVSRLQPASSSFQPIIETNQVKLTHFTHGLGCACKLRPQNLEKVLSSLPGITHPQVLVSAASADDAAVYKISNDLALVQTVDFFTPVVDAPYSFGAIAAANSLSDIYAMGATPLFALNIVGFPEKRLPLSVLENILKGANDKAAEAGIPIVGGHTIEDPEPKFGLAVTGSVHPDKILTNSNARPGDVLILTKPIGLGILTTGLKRGILSREVSQKVIEIMSTLNRTAAEVLQSFPVNACTDVTGFGLLGHLKELTVASKVNAEISLKAVPFIAEAVELAQANIIPGGTVANLEYVAPFVDWDEAIPPFMQLLACDAQTSGGLLIAVPEKNSQDLQNKLSQKKVAEFAIIGRITETGQGKIRVLN